MKIHLSVEVELPCAINLIHIKLTPSTVVADNAASTKHNEYSEFWTYGKNELMYIGYER